MVTLIRFGKFSIDTFRGRILPLATVENPLLQANKFNEFYANVGTILTMTALKATKLAEEHNFDMNCGMKKYYDYFAKETLFY